MRRLLVALGAAAALISSAANAADGTVTVNGDVAEKCLFTTDSATVTIPELSFTTGALASIGKLDATTVNTRTATLAGWCNATAAVMSVEASPLVNAATVPTGFTNTVNYTAAAEAHPDSGDVSVSDSTTTPGGSSSSAVGIFASDIDVTFSLASAPGNALLAAGAYTGSVVVTLSPSI